MNGETTRKLGTLAKLFQAMRRSKTRLCWHDYQTSY